MKTNMSVVMAFAATLGMGVEARAQAATAESVSAEASIRALLLEVRHLREAVEKQSSATTRAQLLVTRLTLQDQRVNKAQAAVDQAAEAVESLKSEIENYRSMASAATAERSMDAEVKARMEQQLRMFKDHAAAEEARLPELEARLDRAKAALESERDKYDALDTLLTQFDGELGRKLS